MSSIAGMPATKHGLVYDDHHFKRDGKVESTPPTNMKSLYDYLPSDQVATSAKHIPSKLCLKGDNPTSHAACLKQQTRCLGVYTRVPGRDANGHPMWKHVDDDLCIGSAKVDGEAGWVVAQFTTWKDDKQDRCMHTVGQENPWSTKCGSWKAWNGRAWEEAAGVTFKATYHGWGREGTGQWSNTESSVSPTRLGSPKRRALGSPGSPGSPG